MKVILVMSDPRLQPIGPRSVTIEGTTKTEVYGRMAKSIIDYAAEAGIHPSVVQYSQRWED